MSELWGIFEIMELGCYEYVSADSEAIKSVDYFHFVSIVLSLN